MPWSRVGDKTDRQIAAVAQPDRDSVSASVSDAPDQHASDASWPARDEMSGSGGSAFQTGARQTDRMILEHLEKLQADLQRIAADKERPDKADHATDRASDAGDSQTPYSLEISHTTALERTPDSAGAANRDIPRQTPASRVAPVAYESATRANSPAGDQVRVEPPGQAAARSTVRTRSAADRIEASSAARQAAPVEPAEFAAPVEQAQPVKPAGAGEWRPAIEEAIEQLRANLRDLPLDADERRRQEVHARLLSFVAGQKETAFGTADELDESEREFLRSLLFSLHLLLDSDGMPAHRRATAALRHLREAADHLAAVSMLDVHNLAFCRSVENFGRYIEFETDEFEPGEEVVLYVEIDNFHVEQKTSREFETSLQGSYDIFNTNNELVASHEFPLVGEVCASRRRDYFIAYNVRLPANAIPGMYRMQLTVKDMYRNKFGQDSITFRIK